VTDDPRRAIAWDDPHPPRWFPRAIAYVMLAIVMLVAARSIFHAIGGFLTTILVSLFLSFALEPAVDWFAARGWRRGPATGLVFLLVAVAGGILTWLMVSLVVEQVTALVEDAPRLVQNAADWANERFDAQITTTDLLKRLEEYQGQLASTAGDLGGRVLSVTGSVIGVVFQGFTVALFTFYLVADGPRWRRSLCSVLPPERQRLVLGLWDLAVAKTGGYLYSRLLLAVFSSIAGWIGFSIIGVASPLALALWLGVVSQFVPVIGTYIGGALPLLIALLNDPVKALWVLGFLIVYQQIENYLLSPRITSRTMEIHPAVAFGSAIVGASVIGPIGALLALPAAAIVQAFVSSYLQRYDYIEAEDAPDAEAEAGEVESHTVAQAVAEAVAEGSTEE
jgi:predicted PurR-regulated permease PerM